MVRRDRQAQPARQVVRQEAFASEACRSSSNVASTSTGGVTKETCLDVTSKSTTSGSFERSQARRRLAHSASSRGRLKWPIARRGPVHRKHRPERNPRPAVHLPRFRSVPGVFRSSDFVSRPRNSNRRATIPSCPPAPDHYILCFYLTRCSRRSYPRKATLAVSPLRQDYGWWDLRVLQAEHSRAKEARRGKGGGGDEFHGKRGVKDVGGRPRRTEARGGQAGPARG